MNQWISLAYVACGGAIGASARFVISELFNLYFGRGFPYGTLFVNVLGSFIMGVLMAAMESGMIASQPWRQIIGLGFLGALTTFSTFSMDNVSLFESGDFLKMGLNILLNVSLSIGFAWIGLHLMQRHAI